MIQSSSGVPPTDPRATDPDSLSSTDAPDTQDVGIVDADAQDGADPKLNLKCFLVPVVCWLPVPALMSSGLALLFWSGVVLFVLPLIGAFGVVGLLLFGRSERIKTAGLSFMLGIVAMCVVLYFVSKLTKTP